jgi:hypothetical protein
MAGAASVVAARKINEVRRALHSLHPEQEGYVVCVGHEPRVDAKQLAPPQRLVAHASYWLADGRQVVHELGMQPFSDLSQVPVIVIRTEPLPSRQVARVRFVVTEKDGSDSSIAQLVAYATAPQERIGLQAHIATRCTVELPAGDYMIQAAESPVRHCVRQTVHLREGENGEVALQSRYPTAELRWKAEVAGDSPYGRIGLTVKGADDKVICRMSTAATSGRMLLTTGICDITFAVDGCVAQTQRVNMAQPGGSYEVSGVLEPLTK